MTSRILFLDIDGVLLPHRMYMAAGQTKPVVTMFDPGVVGMLNSIAEETSCKFVIHSSWLALDHYRPIKTHAHMINQGLKEEYFHEDHSVVWPECGSRWMAISQWLHDHPEMEDYLIVDDEHYEGGIHDGHLVKTHMGDGLLFRDYNRIINRWS